MAQRVGEVGIASACRRQAFVRAALVVQARVVWQGTGRVDFGSWFRAVQEQVVAFHASVRGLGFLLWTSALPYFVQKLRALLQHKTFEHYFTTSPLWKNQTLFGGKHGPKLTRLKQGKAPSRIVQNSNFTTAAAPRGRAFGRFAASRAWMAFPG